MNSVSVFTGVNERLRSVTTSDTLSALRHEGSMQSCASAKTLRKRARIVKDRIAFLGSRPAVVNIQTVPKEDRRIMTPASSGRAERRRARRNGGSAASRNLGLAHS